MTVEDELQEAFPDHASTAMEPKWKALRADLAIGDEVSGTVRFKSEFGAWIDIGVRFPALLLITEISGLSPDAYQKDRWCPVGSTVTATISAFVDEQHRLGLTQMRSG